MTMTKTLSTSIKIIGIILLVLLIDQSLKIWVKTNMHYGDAIFLLGLRWARIHFVENDGMAFGLTLGGSYGKLALSLFRILAVAFLIYYIRKLIKVGAPFGVLVSFGLILAGAIGNILDSAFYGMIFSDSYHGQLATLFPEEGGYSSFLHGKVVDMFYFPFVENVILPEWVPLWGGQDFTFFKPVFNVADSAITVGVLNILIFHSQFFSTKSEEQEGTDKEEQSSEEETGAEDKNKVDGQEAPDNEEQTNKSKEETNLGEVSDRKEP